MNIVSPLVFIADDDEDDQLLLQLAFRAHSPRCQLNFSGDGQSFLDQLRQVTTIPSLIVLDLNMPFLNGFEVLRSLRSTTRYGQIPVIILTTSSDEGDKQKALELGATSFLTKPLTLEGLQGLVRKLCDQWLTGLC